MDKITKTLYLNDPAIQILDNHAFCQALLCKSEWFKPYEKPEWTYDLNPSFTIDQQFVQVIFDSAITTFIKFEKEGLRDEVFDWAKANDPTTLDYWKKQSTPILAKLKSENLDTIKTGIRDLNQWVVAFNQQPVEGLTNNADLSLFGYLDDNWEEGNLWPNELFDQLLITNYEGLETDDLKNLIEALFNANEAFVDCKATHSAMQFLLVNRTPEIEDYIVSHAIRTLDHHEPGHRSFEKGLVDRLVDEIFPSFSASAILKLLQGLHPDNIRNEHYGGQGCNFISLAHHALNKNPTENEMILIKELISEYDNFN